MTNWGWPQYILLAILSVIIGDSIYNHKLFGSRKMSFFITFLYLCVLQIILYFGGFWTP
jgi:hypothetical protein